MEFIGISPEKYTNSLIKTIFINKNNKIPTQVLFLELLSKMSDPSGRVIRKEYKRECLKVLKVTPGLWQKTIDRLRQGDHIKIIGVTIYLNPIYVTAKRCDPLSGGDGIFIISPNKAPKTPNNTTI